VVDIDDIELTLLELRKAVLTGEVGWEALGY